MYHIPSITRANAQEVPRASMKAQHKTLSNRTEAGKGWTLSESIGKAQYIREGENNIGQMFKEPPKWKDRREDQEARNYYVTVRKRCI